MRTAGAVFRKLKEVKFRHWIVFYKQLSRRSPDNCKFNYTHSFIGNDGNFYKIKLCLFHQDNSDKNLNFLDICQTDSDCAECNAFINRYSREDIKKMYIKELETKKIKELKYPDICALEWVLERSVLGIPPVSTIQSLYFRLKKILFKNKIL